MQPRTPPRKITCRVNGHDTFTVPGRHSHHSKQFDGQLSLSATDTCPHRSLDAAMRSCVSGRSLALDHGLVYPHLTGGQNHPRSRQNSAARSAPAAGSAGMSHSWMGTLSTVRTSDVAMPGLSTKLFARNTIGGKSGEAKARPRNCCVAPSARPGYVLLEMTSLESVRPKRNGSPGTEAGLSSLWVSVNCPITFAPFRTWSRSSSWWYVKRRSFIFTTFVGPPIGPTSPGLPGIFSS